MSAPSFDELLLRLARAEVRFVVIGGLALGSWGVVRGTKDCDIVPDPEPGNLEKLAAFAAELGGHVQLGDRGTVLVGGLPGRALKLVDEWAGLHREELEADWSRAKDGGAPEPIDPLP